MRLKLLSFFLIFVSYFINGQSTELGPNSQVSVLTFGPGQSLNDAFGHNAFRIKDEKLGLDLVYGYGEYDFDAPNFYLKFARGKLNYLISKHNFSDVFSFYSKYNRRIDDQTLRMSLPERQELFNFLENNYRPENRRYKYDFFYDNCATKIRDITNLVTPTEIDFTKPQNFEPKTFRSLIYEHLNKNSWGSLGIDIALGSVIDRETLPNEYMFLPKYIHIFFEKASVNDQTLVTKSKNLFEPKSDKSNISFVFSPLLILGILGLVIVFFTFRDYRNRKRTKWLDISLFGITGIIGLLLLFLWFGTDHTATANNYNLLWAMPINLFAIVQLLKKQAKPWLSSYLKFLIIMLCLLTLHWLMGVQIFAIGLLPLLFAILLRYIYLIKFYSSQV